LLFFPSIQGGPHENTIAGIAVSLKEAMSPEFKKYDIQVKKNAAKLAEEMTKRGHVLITGGTDNHLILWDVRPHSLTGSKVEKLLEIASISVNKNAVYGDTSALAPGGVRVGTPAVTSRGLNEADMVKVAEFLDRGAKLSIALQNKVGKQLAQFVPAAEASEEVQALKKEVEAFASGFPMPG